MSLLEDVKKITQRVTGWQRPSAEQLDTLVRSRKPTAIRFRDDGSTPNHPRWPLVVYRGVVELPRLLDPAAVWEDIFESHGWGDTWRGEIYDFLHYHSRIHEALGIARGSAKVRFGGNKGRIVTLKAGDLAILPAGTGHQCLWASKTFLAIGAYPPFGTYDECLPGDGQHDRAVRTIRRAGRPRQDPVFGSKGLLLKAWPPKR
jgi:uncharacterized protein YjlB